MADRALAEKRRATLDGLHRYRRIGCLRAAPSYAIEELGSATRKLLVHRPEHVEHRLLAHVRTTNFLDRLNGRTHRSHEIMLIWRIGQILPQRHEQRSIERARCAS